jgi:thioredoxin-related protein
MIKKILMALILMWGAANASSIHWEKDYQAALTKAKMSSKPAMFIVSNHNCRYCVMLEKKTLTDELVVNALNRDFISVIAYVDDRDYVPNDLFTGGTPTIWFLKPDGEPMFQPLMGALDAENFIKALSIVHDEFAKTKK